MESFRKNSAIIIWGVGVVFIVINQWQAITTNTAILQKRIEVLEKWQERRDPFFDRLLVLEQKSSSTDNSVKETEDKLLQLEQKIYTLSREK